MELTPPASMARFREDGEPVERAPRPMEGGIAGGSFAHDVIDLWKTSSSRDYKYFDKVGEQIAAFWGAGSVFRTQFELMDRETVVEIACGKGRHTAQALPMCGTIWATDTSIDALRELAERFKDVPAVRPLLVSGDGTLPETPEQLRYRGFQLRFHGPLRDADGCRLSHGGFQDLNGKAARCCSTIPT